MNMKKAVKWYFLLKKRLLKKPAFLMILLSIPILTLAFFHFASTEDTGFLHIVLSQKEESRLGSAVIERITESSDMIRFSFESDPAVARKKVESGECDSAWILENDLESKVVGIAKGNREILATAIERDQSTLNDIAKEQIFAAFYSEIAYEVYENYAASDIENADESELLSIHSENGVDGELISFQFEDAGDVELSGVNYLISPLRGLLSVVMLMCALAASVYFLADERDGTFTMLSRERRFLVLFATNLAALTISGVFVSAALYFTGNYKGFAEESLIMILYIFALAGFSSVLGTLVSNVDTFCVFIPVVCVLSLVLAPVFFDLIQLRPLQALLPVYHYMAASTDGGRVWPLALYGAVSAILGYLLYGLTVRLRYRSYAKRGK